MLSVRVTCVGLYVSGFADGHGVKDGLHGVDALLIFLGGADVNTVGVAVNAVSYLMYMHSENHRQSLMWA